MEEKHKFIGIMGIIALRKSELYNRVINEISKDCKVSEIDIEKIKQYIAEMDNNRFLSEEEKKNKRINSELKIDDNFINIELIKNEVKLNLSRKH